MRNSDRDYHQRIREKFASHGEVKTVEQAKQVIEDAVQEWLYGRTEGDIYRQVFAYLDMNSQTIVRKLLGFDKDTFNQHFTLDHCNGRAGSTAAGDYLRSAATTAIREWFERNVPAHLFVDALSEKEVADFIAEGKREYAYVVRQKLRDLAAREAEKSVQKFLQEVISPDKKTDK
jgi:hypothetical protein